MTWTGRLALGLAPVLDGALERRLHPEERGMLPARASAKRRAEFAAGRVAARTALAWLLGRESCDLPVLREPGTGRPLVEWTAGSSLPLHVSISHADGLAVATAAHVPIGVDLVTVQSSEASFAREAFVAGELAGWASWFGVAAEDPFAAAAAFAAKEAASKWLGVGLTVPLLEFRVEPTGQRWFDRVCGLATPVEAFRAALVPAAGRPCVLAACLARFGRQLMVALSNREGDPSESQLHGRFLARSP